MLKKSMLLVFLILIGACTTPPIAPPPKAEPPIKVVGSPIEIALTGIGGSKLSARVRPQTLDTEVSSRIILGDAIIRSSTDIVPLGQARTSGHRYLHVTLPISLLEGTFTNLTFMAMNDPKSGSLSAVSELSRYPGLAAYTQSEFDALAASIAPTSPISLEPRSQSPALLAGEEDALQIYTENEVSSLGNVLPYGFVAHNGTSRTITSTGTITIAMRVPLQALAKDDPYTIKLRFGIYEDSTTIITESLEAQLPINQAAFKAVRTRVGGELRVMPGTTKSISAPIYLYSSPRVAPSQTTLAICQVRTVGTAISSTAYLVNRVPTAVALKTRVITTGQTLPLETTISDAAGEYYLPTQISLTDSSLGGIRSQHLTAFGAGATTVSTNVCGLTGVSHLNVLTDIIPISGGALHSLALQSDDTVAAWGSNGLGQTTIPSDLTAYSVQAVAGGSYHSLALQTNGVVRAWGYAGLGQTTVPSGLVGIVAIETGTYHSLALNRTGGVVAWGLNNSAQTDVPTDLTNVAAITGGNGYSLALKSDGRLVVWGSENQSGQTDIPTGLNDVIAISSGAYHNLALQQNGTVVAWGDNRYGQSAVPTDLTGVIAISAGSFHSIALKADGTVVAWGSNDYGQLTVPTGLTGVVAIAAGEVHNLALKADGSITAWGYSSYGQTTIPDISPLTFKIP
jgi:alpha-tubulin suppressor-like RCC1 family protein